MKIYKVSFSDRHGEYCGSLADMFINEEAADKAMKWHDSHPMPDDPGVLHFWIETVDTADVKDEFIPPMTEERYKQMCDECYGYHLDRDYLDDYDDYDFPEPTEEELEECHRIEEMANELQEKMAEIEERDKRENTERIDQAIKLCEEIMGK